MIKKKKLKTFDCTHSRKEIPTIETDCMLIIKIIRPRIESKYIGEKIKLQKSHYILDVHQIDTRKTKIEKYQQHTNICTYIIFTDKCISAICVHTSLIRDFKLQRKTCISLRYLKIHHTYMRVSMFEASLN